MSKSAIIFAPLILVLLANSVLTADLHFTGVSSVDGREIRYEDHTQFDNQRTWAINQ